MSENVYVRRTGSLDDIQGICDSYSVIDGVLVLYDFSSLGRGLGVDSDRVGIPLRQIEVYTVDETERDMSSNHEEANQ